VRFLQPAALGAITPEVVEQALTAKTKLVALASCHFLTGNRIQIDTIGRLLRTRGILFCLDAIQTVGAFETLVDHVDFLSADSHKWMLGPMAAGIVYVKEELQDVLRPTLIGAWNVKSPNFIAQETVEFEPGARRYEPGVLNMAGILGMKASIELLNEAGIDNISARLLHLRDCLRRALSPLGFQLIEPSEGCMPHGISTFAHPTRDLAAAFQHLAAHKVHVSHRHDRSGHGYLSFSPHFYNTEGEIEQIAALLSS
jgi:cysteine desulfurase / selenocysteine lyase